MIETYIPGWNKCTIKHNPTYDTSNFVNKGKFFDTHPGVIPNITRYERTDLAGKVIESWERNKNGVMVDVTERDKLYAEIEAAQEALEAARITNKEAKANV